MGKDAQKVVRLNLGCGEKKFVGDGWVNVDGYGEPDVKVDLNKFPYPWKTNSVDHIYMSHILEHIPDWWSAFLECSRILKPNGTLEIRVPDESSATALTYRDHHHVFSIWSFHGVQGSGHGTNSWAKDEKNSVPLILEGYQQVPYKKYSWMIRFCPWLLEFCAAHLRNFIHEQVFIFRKTS